MFLSNLVDVLDWNSMIIIRYNNGNHFFEGSCVDAFNLFTDSNELYKVTFLTYSDNCFDIRICDYGTN